jgi:hypothetical protein
MKILLLFAFAAFLFAHRKVCHHPSLKMNEETTDRRAKK